MRTRPPPLIANDWEPFHSCALITPSIVGTDLDREVQPTKKMVSAMPRILQQCLIISLMPWAQSETARVTRWRSAGMSGRSCRPAGVLCEHGVIPIPYYIGLHQALDGKRRRQAYNYGLTFQPTAISLRELSPTEPMA